MKKPILLFLALILLLVSCSKKDSTSLTVYAYDSFCSSSGAGPIIVKEFEEKTGIKVNLVRCGSSVETYSKVEFEKEKCKADVIVGLSDFSQYNKDLFISYIPDYKDNLISYNTDNNLLPFDWGVFAFNINEKTDLTYPESLKDLTKDQYKKQIILIDPRTSIVGLGSLLWSIEALGEKEAFVWWKQVSENALTICDSWSSAYGIFTEHEADIVLSYQTSPVYHRLVKDGFETKALLFKDGLFRTVEYLGILKSSQKQDKAKLFVDFMLNEAQETLSDVNTMYPANTQTKLSDEFTLDFDVNEIININHENHLSDINRYLDKWTEVVVCE